MSELVYRRPCEHGEMEGHPYDMQVRPEPIPWCPGGVERVLDADKVLIEQDYAIDDVSVADILAVLDMLDGEA